MAPVIMDTARELAKDPKSLNHLKLDRTTSSYKMRFGLGKTFQDETLNAIRTTPFSLNIDESTSNSNKRVLAILASYYSHQRKGVLVEHLASLEVIKVDSQSLFDELDELFVKHNIPWTNLVSILMDSCNVMRGSKSGVETRIRSGKAPQLLDVDGDSCHHMHNACKQFCKPFDNWAEYLQSDIHNDVKWSPDLRQYLEEICSILGIKFTMPQRFLNHRWLSCYDACSSNMAMMDAFHIFYYSFLEPDDKALFKEPARKILDDRKVSQQGIQRVITIWKELGKKKLTDDGKRRKTRIAQKVVVQTTKTMLTMNFFIAVLPIMKEYVCLFQSREPLIHLLHDKQEQVFKDFMACFVKSENLVHKTAKQLKLLNLDSDEGLFLHSRDMFVGRPTREMISTCHKRDKTVLEFLQKVSTAYSTCAKYMQKKLPLDNKLLRTLSSIDPRARGHSETSRAMTGLGEYVKPFLSKEQQNSLPLEILKYQVDGTLKNVEDGERIEDWWGPIIDKGKYPAMSRMVTVCLSCFHGPMVESSFNLMGDIIDIRSTRMNIATFSAIQTVKYGLMSRKMTALECFRKGDVKHDPIDGHLCRNFKTAAAAYAREKKEKKQQKEDKLTLVRLQQEKVDSRAQQKRRQEQAAKVARLAHQKAQKRKATERLMQLVAKRKKAV